MSAYAWSAIFVELLLAVSVRIEKNGIAYVKRRSDEVHSVCLCVSGVPGDDRGRIKTRNATMEDQDTVSAMKVGRYQ